MHVDDRVCAQCRRDLAWLAAFVADRPAFTAQQKGAVIAGIAEDLRKAPADIQMRPLVRRHAHAGGPHEADVWFQSIPADKAWSFAALIEGLNAGGVKARPIEFSRNPDYLHRLSRGPLPKIIICIGYENTHAYRRWFAGRGVAVATLDNGWLPHNQFICLDAQGLLSDHSMVGDGSVESHPALVETIRQRYQARAEAAASSLWGDYIFVPMRPYGSGPDLQRYAGRRFRDAMALYDDDAPEEAAIRAMTQIIAEDFPAIPAVYKLRLRKDWPDAKRSEIADMYHRHTRPMDHFTSEAPAPRLSRDARAVVALHSNCLTEAVLLGTPAVALGRGTFDGAAVVLDRADGGSLANVLSWRPKRRDVDAYISKLLYYQVPRYEADLDWTHPFFAWVRDTVGPQVEAVSHRRAAEHQAIATELKLPSPLLQAATLGRHLLEIRAHHKKTGRLYVGEEWAEARRAVCAANGCGKMQQHADGNRRCKACGCNVSPIVGRSILRNAVGKVAGALIGGEPLKTKCDYEALTCEHWADIDKHFGARLAP